jgi:hypothetical protein
MDTVCGLQSFSVWVDRSIGPLQPEHLQLAELLNKDYSNKAANQSVLSL